MTSTAPIRFALAMLLLATPATALPCREAGQMRPVLHETVPQLDEGEVAARVMLEGVDGFQITATVEQWLVGDYTATQIVVSEEIISSCDGPVHPGSSGIIVGRVLEVSAEKVHILLRRAPSPSRSGREARALPSGNIDISGSD